MDYVAASFVQKAEDVLAIRQLLTDNGYNMGIIAKIENQAGVNNIKSILDASDGIMVARGDLGVEIPAEDVQGQGPARGISPYLICGLLPLRRPRPV